MKGKYIFLIAFMLLGLGCIFEPNTPVRESIFFWLYAFIMLFAILNVKYQWIKD